MKKLTREWVRKAEDDYEVAVSLAAGSKPHHDQVCFHCQQSAEKYLKALLEEAGLPVRRTHNLDDLYMQLTANQSALRSLRRGLIFLTDFAVETRYPGEHASKRQAGSALRWAEKIRIICRTLLGLQT